jgi:P-type Ca2+ transporter type 2C
MSEAGLSAVDAQRRLETFGPNDLVPPDAQTGALATLRHIVTDPMAILLAIASATYYVLGEVEDAVIAFVALVPVVGVGLLLELRAERALEGLRRMTAPTARAIRDGAEVVVPARDLVPGDAIVLREGDIVPADARVLAGADLVVDESSLTGESQPLSKLAGSDSEASLWAGTTVLAGRARATVSVTGRRTRYGQIAELVGQSAPARTPLQSLVRRLFIRLSLVAGAFCIAVVALEMAGGASVAEALIAGVSLAMAGIPEEFPMVFTLYLALGAWRLARDHALVRRLVGVETLGATSVICADKTGTLTLGTIEVASLWTAAGVTERALLEAAVLASEPEPYDPLDQAIVRRAAVAGVDAAQLHARELVRDHAFDPASRSLTHVWRDNDLLAAYAKGALEGIAALGMTDASVRSTARAVNEDLAARGMRVIAVASSSAVDRDGDRASDERGLRIVGLVAFVDPIRPGVAASIAECRTAGVRVMMITGDHPTTARAVAEGVGIHGARVATGDDIDGASDTDLAQLVMSTDVFARSRPEQKHRLVRALKASGEVVAMTGDGTNDAPALREADIGIAVGRRGTDVARGAATLVLLDDDFSTIVAAIRDGRRIFENLRRAFSYLIAFHAPLLLSAIVVPVAGAPILLLPVHLVWLELLLHPTVALVFEADPPTKRLMHRPPRRRSAGLVRREQLVALIARGLSLTVAVLALYLGALGLGQSEDSARGLALITLIVGQLLLVLVERSDSLHVWHRLSENRVLPWIVAFTLGSLIVVELVPAIASAIHVTSPSAAGWALAIVVASAATLWGEITKTDIPNEEDAPIAVPA